MTKYMKDVLRHKVMELFTGKTSRFNYFLSLLIVVAGFYYVFVFCDAGKCLTCHPVTGIPWGNLLSLTVFLAVGGIYLCAVLCYAFAVDDFFSGSSAFWLVLLSIFFAVQTSKRCHDINYSGWRALMPFFPPLVIMFWSNDDEKEESKIMSILMTLWEAKWLLLALIGFCLAIYLENQQYILMHHRIYGSAWTNTHIH